MIFVLDAFNVLYKLPELEEHMFRGELGAAMSGLVELLARARRAHKQRTKKDPHFHVFFDGKRRSGDDTRHLPLAGMDLYYSHDESADFLIEGFLRTRPVPGQFCVVSSDKAVLDTARRYRCSRQTSEEFAKWLETTLAAGRSARGAREKDEPALDADELRYWQKMFQERKK